MALHAPVGARGDGESLEAAERAHLSLLTKLPRRGQPMIVAALATVQHTQLAPASVASPAPAPSSPPPPAFPSTAASPSITTFASTTLTSLVLRGDAQGEEGTALATFEGGAIGEGPHCPAGGVGLLELRLGSRAEGLHIL